MRELFKSTPNLNNKERKGPLGYGMMGHFYGAGYPPPSAPLSPGGHIRSTSYSISYGRGKPMASPTADIKGLFVMKQFTEFLLKKCNDINNCNMNRKKVDFFIHAVYHFIQYLNVKKYWIMIKKFFFIYPAIIFFLFFSFQK